MTTPVVPPADTSITEQLRAQLKAIVPDAYQRNQGAELEALVTQLAATNPDLFRNPDTIPSLAKIVRSNHADEEVAAAKAAHEQELRQKLGRTNPIPEVPDSPYKRRLDNLGINEAQLDEMLRKFYPTDTPHKAREKWLLKAKEVSKIMDADGNVRFDGYGATESDL